MKVIKIDSANKTIAQQLNVNVFPFEIKDKNGMRIYYEKSNGFWEKTEYDTNGNQTRYEDSSGFWCKRQYDTKRNQIYYESSIGIIIDDRPKQVELTLDDIAQKFGVDVNQLKIKK